MRSVSLVLFGVLGLGMLASLGGPVAMADDTETVSYTTLRSAVQGDAELSLRAYPARIVASVRTSGTQREAVNAGFRPLADYIFGKAQQGAPAPVAMTAPVLQQPAPQKIAMTAPVLQTAATDAWLVQFVMPEGLTTGTLPRPSNPQVRLETLPARQVAAIRFSGRATPSALAERTAELEDWVRANGWQAAGPVTYAFYNPPWTLPWWRRNEVWVEVRGKD